MIRTYAARLTMLILAMVMIGVSIANAQNIGEDEKNGAGGKKNGNDAVIVHPGETKTVRGVTVDNTGNTKDVTIQPTGATAVSVNPSAGAQFTVTGVEAGDSVNVINGCGATVNGSGGNVNCSSNSSVGVSVSSSQASNSMKVQGPNSTCVLSAGSSATFIF